MFRWGLHRKGNPQRAPEAVGRSLSCFSRMLKSELRKMSCTGDFWAMGRWAEPYDFWVLCRLRSHNGLL